MSESLVSPTSSLNESSFSSDSNFAAMLEESLQKLDAKPGSIVDGKIIKIAKDYILVDAGFKSEAKIPLNEFEEQDGSCNCQVGDIVQLVVELPEGSVATSRLSREKARRLEAFNKLAECYNTQETVLGSIIEKVRGGFTVDVNKFKAFLPSSLLDVKPLKDTTPYEGVPLEFKVIKVDNEVRNIVLSRKAVIVEKTDQERAKILSCVNEGDILTGVVKNITDYGVFIDLGGADGLLHITDISWKRIKHPSEVLNVGDTLKVKVLKFDKEKNRVSLGLKQLEDDPWADIKERYPLRSKLVGKITNITDYGLFVEIEHGVEGLVHMSEIDWTNKITNPTKMFSVGQEIEVMVLEILPEKRRISLGIKQCTANPWDEFSTNYKIGDKITGVVKSVTDFGIFVGLPGNIDGLVHVSDISWSETGEKVLEPFKKGDAVEVIILGIDVDRERISLGIKQLQPDNYADYLNTNPHGSVVGGKIFEVNSKYALVDLGENIVGKIRAADASRLTVKDLTELLNVGDEVEGKIMGFDKKFRQVNLSLKELQPDIDERSAPGNTQLRDLLKEQMQNNE